MTLTARLNTVHDLLRAMLIHKASDLFISSGSPASFKTHGSMEPANAILLSDVDTREMAQSIMSDKQRAEFEATSECNFAIAPEGIGRFRVNIFVQQQRVSMVLRTIETEIPDFDKMGLPAVLKNLVMEKRGLVLLVGGTGSGKSTSLAAMIGHRNRNSKGHIITIEDPVEYVHKPAGCIISHREVGVDTESWQAALKNTLRQAPDVILIGEIRDMETMEHALAFAETGHLCLATLHANSANQALERIMNFFPFERREQLQMNLSLNIKGIVSQRLVPKVDGGRVAAIEIMLASSTIKDMISKGAIGELKNAIAKSRELGMQTFDQVLFDLYETGLISYEETIRNADAVNDLRLKLKLQSKRFIAEGDTTARIMTMAPDKPDEVTEQAKGVEAVTPQAPATSGLELSLA